MSASRTGEVGKQKAEICAGRLEIISEEGFITKEVVAERLCVTPQTVVRWARTGRLPSHRFGRQVRFKWSEVAGAPQANEGGEKQKAEMGKLK